MTAAIAIVALALLVGAVGIALGILAAPALDRLADRIARDDDEEADGR